MRAKLCPFILASFACAQLATPAAWSAGRPTHTIARDNRRLVLSASPHESPHARVGHSPAKHTPAHGHASGSPKTSRKGHHEQAEARHSDSEPHHGRHTGRHEAVAQSRSARRNGRETARETARASSASTEDRTTNDRSKDDRATSDRVHAWEQSQKGTPVPPVATGRPVAEQALEAAGAEIAATAISPAETLSPTLPPASRAELPRISTIEQEAATPVLLPSLYDKRGHLVVPMPLYGTHDVLVHQNTMADHDGLTRVRDDEDLADLRREHKLVPLPESGALRVDERLPVNRRYSRPWTAVFLAVLSRDFYASFHQPLQLTSAVRTVQTQQRLLRTNRNAAPIAGETASPHLTGQAVDLGKKGLTMAQIAWLRAYLQPLIEGGKIDVEEEFQQSCFHISVYRNYTVPVRESLASAGLPRASGSY